MKWDAGLYQEQHGFVAQYGRSLLEHIPRRAEQAILDLGCGTGTLSALLAEQGTVIGIDASPDMVRQARRTYPHLEFHVMDACSLEWEGRFDVVFSNAVLHWILDQDRLLDSVRRVLRPGGRFVCEFGAEGNVAAIRNAFSKAVRPFGLENPLAFFLPSRQLYRQLLESHGFFPDLVRIYERPTPLRDGAKGLEHWVRQFFSRDLIHLLPEQQAQAIRKMEDLLRESLWDGTQWIADYRRIQVVAHRR